MGDFSSNNPRTNFQVLRAGETCYVTASRYADGWIHVRKVMKHGDAGWKEADIGLSPTEIRALGTMNETGNALPPGAEK